MRRALELIAVVLLCMAFASTVSGEVTHCTDGCYYCKSVAPTGGGQTCTRAGLLSSGLGDGLNCWEDDSFAWPEGPTCWTDGNPCYETVVNGGPGGGQSSGGGGSTCRYENGYCAPWCGSCNRIGPA